MFFFLFDFAKLLTFFLVEKIKKCTFFLNKSICTNIFCLGTNAKLKYSIEKNVIDEHTGTPIFEIEEETGVIKTAVCCLDREKTPDYSIQVVAMDGGGLKGTGTASIRVKDINDMPPSFTKEEWITEVDETDGNLLPGERF